MRLLTSSWRKGLLTILAAGGFIYLYETTIPDSRFSVLPLGFELATDANGPPAPGVRVAFSATAYCKGQVTAQGVAVQDGAVAADPAVLPGGSVINIDVENPAFDGIYTVLDTGPEIKGREVDLYMWSCIEAMKFGRQPAHITVLRLGWDPHATTPSFVDRILRRPPPPRPKPAPAPAPTPVPPLESRPLPLVPGNSLLP
jgi:3D (Asp-Asp-Asp) domain-containing protein